MVRAFLLPAALFLLAFLPGWVTFSALCRREGEKKPSVPLLLPFWFSLLLSGWWGLLLAQLGIFSLKTLCIVLAVYCLPFLPSLQRHGFRPLRLPPLKPLSALGLTAAIGVGAVLFFRPHEYVHGGWDPGVYFNTGNHISDAGSISVRDPLWGSLSPEEKDLFGYARWRRLHKFPGFISERGEGDVLTPEFYHLYPVWIAITRSLFGLRAGLYVNPFFSLLSCVCLFFLGRRFSPSLAGLLAAFLLAGNLAQVWNARFGCPEPLMQFLLLGGCLSLALFFEGKGSLYGLLAALSLGEALLTRVTGVLILPCVYLVFIDRKGRGLLRRDLWFFLPFLLFLLHLILQTALVTRGYVLFQRLNIRYVETRYLPYARYLVPIGAAALFVWAGAFSRLIRKRISREALFCLLLGLMLYGLFIRPHVYRGFEAQNIWELSWFFTFPGLLLAFAGALIFVRRELRSASLPFFLLALATTLFFLYGRRIFPKYPWATRRFVPMVIPSLCLFAGVALDRVRGAFGKAGFPVVSLAALGMVLFPALRMPLLYREGEYEGLLAQTQKFAQGLPEEGLYVFDGYWLATPASLLFGKKALQLSDLSPEKAARIVEVFKGWLKEGRRLFYITTERDFWAEDVGFVQKGDPFPFSSRRLRQEIRTPPRRLDPFRADVRVYEVRPIGGGMEREPLPCRVEIGKNAFGLREGFSDSRTYWENREARWTEERAMLAIPLPPRGIPCELVVSMAGGRDRPLPARAEFILGGVPVGGTDVEGGFREYVFPVPPAALDQGPRGVLEIRSTLWDTRSSGLRGFPKEVGVLIDWIEVRKAM